MTQLPLQTGNVICLCFGVAFWISYPRMLNSKVIVPLLWENLTRASFSSVQLIAVTKTTLFYDYNTFTLVALLIWGSWLFYIPWTLWKPFSNRGVVASFGWDTIAHRMPPESIALPQHYAPHAGAFSFVLLLGHKLYWPGWTYLWGHMEKKSTSCRVIEKDRGM